MVKVRIELHHLYDAEFVLNSLRFVMRLVNVFFFSNIVWLLQLGLC